MGKTIMILGAGVYQVPLIKKAKELKLDTVVLSIEGNYPGIAHADTFLPINTVDTQAVLKAAKELQIDAILTTGSDVCIPTIGAVVDEMGLAGSSTSSAHASLDKILMKDRFIQHNVATAAFEHFTDSQDALKFAKKIGFPVMIKAPDSSGSRGIFKVEDESTFENYFIEAMKTSRSKRLIVEYFLEGIEFGAQAVIHNKKVKHIFFHNDTLNNACTPIGHSFPFSDEMINLDEASQTIENAVKALDIDQCIANVDCKMHDSKVHILEIGARMGGTCIPENIYYYSGLDPYAHIVELALGNHPSISTPNKQPNASMLLQSPSSGTVKNFSLADNYIQNPNILEYQWDIAPGDPVNAFRVGPDRIGHVIAKGDSVEQAEELAAKALHKMNIQL